MSIKPKSKNITWHEHAITKEDRIGKFGHHGATLWFTGLSGSGKSTLANAVSNHLFEQKIFTYILDGDNIRHGLNKDLGFSPADREENIRRIGEMAFLFADSGCVVCTAFISPYNKDRDLARSLHETGDFIEVYCRCSLAKCEERDPKGLYKKARAGEIPQFTGISAPYEVPETAELVVDTDKLGIEESVSVILDFLRSKGIMPE